MLLKILDATSAEDFFVLRQSPPATLDTLSVAYSKH